jgi:alpha-L-arabinofuranosidase
LTLTNPSLDAAVSTRIRITGGSAVEGRGLVLTHENMMARNTFDRPEEVKLAPLPVNVRGGLLEVAIPRHAVVSIDVRVS